jgi:hypothetical protein
MSKRLRILAGLLVVAFVILACGTVSTTTVHSCPQCTVIPPAPLYSSLSAGADHTCALDANGAAYCWGNNASGELGDGTQVNSSRPVKVAGGHVFRAISAGTDHTCALGSGSAADSDKVFCWGSNAQGQLGMGQAPPLVNNEIKPTQIASTAPFAGSARAPRGPVRSRQTSSASVGATTAMGCSELGRLPA